MYTFRPLNLETDAADMARLYSYTIPEPITEATAREWWTPREGEFRVTTLALDEQGKAIGYWDIDHEAWMKPGHFWSKIIVTPEHRGKGLGARMYEDALCIAREQKATQLESTIRDDDPATKHFVEKRGFEIWAHLFESTLELDSFDEHRFDDLLARVHADGFRFFSLAEAGVTEENKHKLYEINRACSLDDPSSDGSFSDFYAFSKNVFDAAWFRADSQILVAHGEEWMGLAAIGIYKEDNHAYNAVTGVLRQYRGRGVAQALKLHTILLAKREGMRYIRTHNDSRNAPMLAINRKLGYKPESGVYRIFCNL